MLTLCVGFVCKRAISTQWRKSRPVLARQAQKPTLDKYTRLWGCRRRMSRGGVIAAHLGELLVFVGETVNSVVEDFLHQTLLVVWNTKFQWAMTHQSIKVRQCYTFLYAGWCRRRVCSNPKFNVTANKKKKALRLFQQSHICFSDWCFVHWLKWRSAISLFNRTYVNSARVCSKTLRGTIHLPIHVETSSVSLFTVLNLFREMFLLLCPTETWTSTKSDYKSGLSVLFQCQSKLVTHAHASDNQKHNCQVTDSITRSGEKD